MGERFSGKMGHQEYSTVKESPEVLLKQMAQTHRKSKLKQRQTEMLAFTIIMTQKYTRGPVRLNEVYAWGMHYLKKKQF